MPIPEIAQGNLLDVRRRLGFKATVDVLRFYDETGTEIFSIDHFWNLEPPRVKFGNAYESCRLTIVEDDTNLIPILDPYMLRVDTFRYDMVDEADMTTLSAPVKHYGIRAPQPGRNRVWRAELHSEAFSQNFFQAAGQR